MVISDGFLGGSGLDPGEVTDPAGWAGDVRTHFINGSRSPEESIDPDYETHPGTMNDGPRTGFSDLIV